MKWLRVVCMACKEQIGGAIDTAAADDLTIRHAPHCTATRKQWEEGVYDVLFAQITGSAEHLRRQVHGD